MRHSRPILICLPLAILFANFVPAAEPAYRVNLQVMEDDWGGADRDDIAAVINSAAAELARFVPQRKPDDIRLSFSDEGPIVLFDRGPGQAHQVRLNVRGRYWAQFAFQFGHEHCHILANYRPGPGENKWFEETLCETASLFVLRRMAETWKTNPPYSNWRDFHASLASYANERMEKSKLPEGVTLAKWYAEHAEQLRRKSTQRDENCVVAVALLPLFEAEPEHWQAVEALNAGPIEKGRSFRDYLQDWRSNAGEVRRPFIVQIAKELGLTLD